MATRKRHSSGADSRVKDNISRKVKVKQKDSNGKKSGRYSFGYKLFLVLFVPLILIIFGSIVLKLTNNRTKVDMEASQESAMNGDSNKAQEGINMQAKKQKTTKKSTESVDDSRTNDYDKKIIKKLNAANKLYTGGQFEEAVKKYTTLIQQHPKSPLAHLGRAQALDQLAEQKQSNEVLGESINAYKKVPDIPDCPKEVQKQALQRLAERLGFFGRRNQAIQTWKRLLSLFPGDVEILKSIGVEYLISGQDKLAKPLFEKILSLNPSNGFAKSHLGFIIKRELNYEKSIPLLREGIASREPGATDGRFYFHLGDALVRTGKRQEAYDVYEDGVKEGVFLSALQRSLYNADTPLKAQPWWTPEETPYLSAIRKLERNWEIIRSEGLAILDSKSSGFLPEDENLKKTGDWGQFTMFQRGQENTAACQRTPKTCALIRDMADAAGCRRGQVKFSVMQPGTYIWPHTGPTNCRIRGHLGLVIPKNCSITVGRITKTWEEGKMIIIDDSIEHEVSHNGDSFRMILIVDFWHPDLTQAQKRTLTAI